MKKVQFVIAIFGAMLFLSGSGYPETSKAVKEQPQVFADSSNAP